MDSVKSGADADLSAPLSVVGSLPRARYARRWADPLYRAVSLTMALSVVVIVAGILAVLLLTAWPAIGRLGLTFFVSSAWNTATDHYGALAFIVGTLLTTSLALLIAVPISIAIAILLTEYAPAALATTMGVIIDVAAGVPTIVFGAWALLALLPWLRDVGEPALAAALGWLPLFNRADIRTGAGILPTGLVLAAMVFPTIVAVTRSSLASTPRDMREASFGLGATRWETATRVVLRQVRSGLIGAIVLACGRALGETMAVVYIIGSVPRLPRSLFDVGNTLSAELLTQVYYGSPIPGTLYAAALYELGLVLLVLSLMTGLLGRWLTRRVADAAALAGGGR